MQSASADPSDYYVRRSVRRTLKWHPEAELDEVLARCEQALGPVTRERVEVHYESEREARKRENPWVTRWWSWVLVAPLVGFLIGTPLILRWWQYEWQQSTIYPWWPPMWCSLILILPVAGPLAWLAGMTVLYTIYAVQRVVRSSPKP